MKTLATAPDGRAAAALPRWNTLCWALGAVLLVVQGAFVLATTTGVPSMDEWDMFGTGHTRGLASGLDLDWIFSFHNEHRIVPTRLLVWLMHVTTGWHLVAFTAVSYLVYAATAALTLRTFERWFAAPLGFLLPAYATSLGFVDHLTGFNLHFHLFLAFLVLALDRARAGGRGVWLAGPLALASAYTFSGGVLAALVVLALCAVLAWRRPAERVALLVQVALIAAGVAAWFIGYPSSPPGAPAASWPWTPAFWRFFAETLSFGFGYLIHEPWSGAALLALLGAAATACLLHLRHERDRAAAETWLALLAWTAAITTVLAAISASRASLGVDAAKSGRYAEIALGLLAPLWLLSRAALQRLLATRPRARRAALVAFAALLLAGYADDFNWHRWAAPARAERLAGQRCVRAIVDGHGDGRCPTVYPNDLRGYVGYARTLGLPFVADLAAR